MDEPVLTEGLSANNNPYSNEQREDAQVTHLHNGGRLAVVIFGGSYVLTNNIARLAEGKCRYAAVTPRAFQQAAEAEE